MQPGLEDLQREIDFIHNSLMADTKNYHTWAYLNWLYSHFSNLPGTQGGNRFSEDEWARELEWCNHMLDSTYKFQRPSGTDKEDSGRQETHDPSDRVDQESMETLGRGDGRNNSAWSWRWHLVIARKGVKPNPAAEIE